jgi:TetR/AcrR family transcriptional repressor of nem operon
MQLDSKTRLLDSALHVIRAKGYAATSVDDICAATALTKGSFFHHFSNKEALAIAAAAHWSEKTDAFFAAAPYQTLQDPLQRLLGYVDFRGAILQGALPDFTCFVGTMVQEVYQTHPRIREACDQSITNHAANVEKDIAAAMRQYAIKAPWTARSLALYTQAVLQGAFVLAKSTQGSAVAADCVAHLRRYIKLVFVQTKPRKTKHAGRC